jgi:hypothetical protein
VLPLLAYLSGLELVAHTKPRLLSGVGEKLSSSKKREMVIGAALSAAVHLELLLDHLSTVILNKDRY